jgi:hypothetical protein
MFKYLKSIKKYKFNISNYFSYFNMENNKFRLSSKEDTLTFLKENNIPYEVEDHEKAENTQEGLERVKTDKVKDWTFCKNFVIKQKSKGFILFTAHHVR